MKPKALDCGEHRSFSRPVTLSQTAPKLWFSQSRAFGFIRASVHRLRKRYRELLRDEIAQTVGSEAEVEGEIRHLFAALSL